VGSTPSRRVKESMEGLIIEEILFQDFPWDKIPWALSEKGRFGITEDVVYQDSVLILWENDKPVAYLCYGKGNVVNIDYVQTNLSFQNRGYATILINKVIEKYNKEFDIKATHTSGTAKRLLQKCGFKQIGDVDWFLSKEQKQTIKQ
jgi:hypothetical protein